MIRAGTVALVSIGAAAVGATAMHRFDGNGTWKTTLAGLVFVGFGLGVTNMFRKSDTLTYTTLGLAAGGVGVAAVGLLGKGSHG